MVKPDGVKRNLIGEVISRVEKEGFQITKMKMMDISEELAKEHYGEHADKPFFNDLVSFITSGPVVAMEVQGEDVVSERHRHRYEFNSRYRAKFEDTNFVCSGESPDGRLVEFIELKDHPFWVATQAHPEFKSRPDRPAPLFRAFVEAALHRAEGRNPQLLQMEEEFSN